MNTNQQKGEKKNTARPSDPDVLSQPRDCLWLGCLNNLWASDPPPELKFELQNKYLSCLEQSLRALFSFLLFKAQPYCSAVPLIVVQGTLGSSPEPPPESWAEAPGMMKGLMCFFLCFFLSESRGFEIPTNGLSEVSTSRKLFAVGPLCVW